MEEKTTVLLITANIGSIFEDPDVMLELWIHEFLLTVVSANPKFIALHCQEVGGKNYETRMKHVENFVLMLLSCEQMQSFDKAEIFLDEDFSCAENFTALGNFYFIHESITNIDIWNFKEMKFQSVNGKNVHSGNIEKIPIKEKSKFPQNFFPECKWSRKGFLRTRWSIHGSVFDLVNLHLFHDASNFIAMQTFPSVYTLTRQKALQYTLNRFYDYEEGSAPFFLFGDFNFRTNTLGVVKKLTEGLKEYKDTNSKEDEKLKFKDDASETVVSIGKKEFCHTDHQNIFLNQSSEWLKEFDLEVEAFKDQLFEYPIQFSPSYPFEENNLSGQLYMKTRCPAWCDRVLLSKTAVQLVSSDAPVEYSIMGKNSCMGDHKPVYLLFDLVHEAGTISTLLPHSPVCSACKLNSSIFCKAFDNSYTLTALASQPNSEAICLPCPHHSSLYKEEGGACPNLSTATGAFASQAITALPINVVQVPSCGRCKKNHRSVSRCLGLDSNLSVMSVVNEISDQGDSGSNKGPNTGGTDSAICLTSIESCSRQRPCKSHSSSSVDSIHSSCSCKCSQCDRRMVEGTINTGIMHKPSSKLPSTRPVIQEDEVSLNCLEYNKRGSIDLYQGHAVRSNSAGMVAESLWRNKTCRCLFNTAWRMRSVSISSQNSSFTSENRVRLKSDPNLKTSLFRIQSHHSSSDEEWFEEVNEVTGSTVEAEKCITTEDKLVAEEVQDRRVEFEIRFQDQVDVAVDEMKLDILDPSTGYTLNRIPQTDSQKRKFFLFCIPRRKKRRDRGTGCKGPAVSHKVKEADDSHTSTPTENRKSKMCC